VFAKGGSKLSQQLWMCRVCARFKGQVSEPTQDLGQGTDLKGDVPSQKLDVVIRGLLRPKISEPSDVLPGCTKEHQLTRKVVGWYPLV